MQRLSTVHILTTFYHMCHLLRSATGDVVKVVYTILSRKKKCPEHWVVIQPNTIMNMILVYIVKAWQSMDWNF